MVRSVAIAQPTFLPWAGWFDLVDQVDLFIILDDVALSKQSWQQRNRIKTRTGLIYTTVPIRSAGRLGQRIIDTEVADAGFVQKLTRTVAQNYARAAHLEPYFSEFCAVLTASAATGKLAELNCGLIDWLATQLGITTRRVRSSELGVSGKRGGHVAMLCEAVGADRYVSPPGAEHYLMADRTEFETRRIGVDLHVYEHPSYRQCFEPFEPYASVLDLLLNEGASAGAIMRSGRRPCRLLLACTDQRRERPQNVVS
jgi:hypothetical protein